VVFRFPRALTAWIDVRLLTVVKDCFALSGGRRLAYLHTHIAVSISCNASSAAKVLEWPCGRWLAAGGWRLVAGDWWMLGTAPQISLHFAADALGICRTRTRGTYRLEGGSPRRSAALPLRRETSFLLPAGLAWVSYAMRTRSKSGVSRSAVMATRLLHHAAQRTLLKSVDAFLQLWMGRRALCLQLWMGRRAL
jgi:hypothetical protein